MGNKLIGYHAYWRQGTRNTNLHCAYSDGQHVEIFFTWGRKFKLGHRQLILGRQYKKLWIGSQRLAAFCTDALWVHNQNLSLICDILSIYIWSHLPMAETQSLLEHFLVEVCEVAYFDIEKERRIRWTWHAQTFSERVKPHLEIWV